MSVLVFVVILCQHLGVDPVEVGNSYKWQQSKTKLDLESKMLVRSRLVLCVSFNLLFLFTFISDCQKLTVEETHASGFYPWVKPCVYV